MDFLLLKHIINIEKKLSFKNFCFKSRPPTATKLSHREGILILLREMCLKLRQTSVKSKETMEIQSLNTSYINGEADL